MPLVAELVTCQKTMQASAPLINITDVLSAMMSKEPDWKIQTASGFPWASKVTEPAESHSAGLL
jgi:hypothetical protein